VAVALNVFEQSLNGFQFGIMLFLMAAGLTLVFGIMNVINLAHGSFYMIGAYVCAWAFNTGHSYLLAVIAGLSAGLLAGMATEMAVFRALYQRDHLDQVLATFGLTMFFNEAVRLVWGATALHAAIPAFLAGQSQLFPVLSYSTYRIAVIGVGLAVAAFLYGLIQHTRLGMLIRAGASNRVMAGALGVNITALYTFVFALGAGLAALAGLMAGPIFTVSSGMGDNVLILAFVVIIIGGLGSIRGAFAAALLVGMVDTLGRAFLRPVLTTVVTPVAAAQAGPALASMLIYILMVVLLFVRPQGLFPLRVR
jgi:branched-chain amino acid transport system permease protein